jgi:hypothetical protein
VRRWARRQAELQPAVLMLRLMRSDREEADLEDGSDDEMPQSACMKRPKKRSRIKDTANADLVKRRMKRSASTLEKLKAQCRTKVWIHRDFKDDIKQVTIPFEFECKDDKTVSTWKINAVGLWKCNICSGKG